MSLSHAIGAELPRLRRFARALTGNQQSGDAYVVTTLQALIAEPSLVSADAARSSLYRLFLVLWNSVDVNRQPSAPADNSTAEPPDTRLQALTPMAREVFLLTAVEQFSPDEAARILGIGEASIRDLLDEAARQIAEQTKTTALIIEDEPLIALDVAELLQQLGHSVIGTARTHKEAIALARERQPGLVIADIQLADGSSGLEAVQEILRSITVPVVFITGFPERLLTGERPEPTYLVEKPYRSEAVKALITQAMFFHPGFKRR